MLLDIWSELLSRPLWRQGLDSVIAVGPFQLGIFCDSMSLYQYHPLNHVPKHHIQPFLKHPQGQTLHHLSEKPIPTSDYSF